MDSMLFKSRSVMALAGFILSISMLLAVSILAGRVPVMKWEGEIVDNLNASPPASQRHFKAEIEEWTSENEIEEMRTILETKGQKGLSDHLANKTPKGRFEYEPSNTIKIVIAERVDEQKGGERFLLVFSGRLGVVEQGESKYLFSTASIVMPKKGKGTGTVLTKASLAIVDGNKVMPASEGKIPLYLKGITATRFQK